MSANMYRVGDYVFFEISSNAPFQIRRIEELNKTQSGNVEAKVMCFYRRRDISPALLKIADSHQGHQQKQTQHIKPLTNGTSTTTGPPASVSPVVNGDDSLNEEGEENKIEEEKTASESGENEEKSNVDDETPKEEVEASASTTTTATPKQTQEETKEKETEASEETEVKKETTEDTEMVEMNGEKESTAGEDGEIEEMDTVETTSTDKSETKSEPKPEIVTAETETADNVTDTADEKTDKISSSIPDKTDKTPGASASCSVSGEENGESEAEKTEEKVDREQGPTVGLPGIEKLNPKERHRLRHRELFLSRQIETLPATHIRGKCCVTLLNELETPDSYLEKDDSFFYSLVYDPTQKTLLADKGEIRIGDRFQARCPKILTEEDRETDREGATMDTLIFHPNHSLTDRDIDQFLIVARAVGTFSRALDTSSSVKLPSLHMTAAAASRDVTLFHAMALLHHAKYDLGQAMKYLVPPPSKQHYPLEADKTTGLHTVSLGGPILCRDQMEEWSAAEANLFEEALEKYGKDFNDIRQDFLPWKSLRDIVEYYYMWKTTDRYVQQKRVKAMEADGRLKQVYIPNYNKPNQNLISTNPHPGSNPKGTNCESCMGEASTQWYLWGPQLALQLCGDCWNYWKKYGGLKRYHPLENCDKSTKSEPVAAAPMGTTPISRPGLSVPGMHHTMPGSGGSSGRHSQGFVPGRVGGVGSNLPTHFQRGSSIPSQVLVGPKTKAAFFLHTTPLTRIARRVAPKNLLNPRKAARHPFIPINMLAIKQYCQTRPQRELLQTVSVMRANAKTSPVNPPQPHHSSTRPTPQPQPQPQQQQHQQQHQQQPQHHHQQRKQHTPQNQPPSLHQAHKRPQPSNLHNGTPNMDGFHQAAKRAREMMASASQNERAAAQATSTEALFAQLYSAQINPNNLDWARFLNLPKQ